MKRATLFAAALLAGGTIFSSCSSDSMEEVNLNDVPQEILAQVERAGFSSEGVTRFENGYLIEGDIYLTAADLKEMAPGTEVPASEQYRTTNLVSASKHPVITMYAKEGGNDGYSAGMIAGLDEAIRRFNAENLTIKFQRVTSGTADIVMTRLSKGDERRGVLGSAGFPTATGDPYGEIKMSGILESSYGLSTNGIATIIAHEMGHCIGFRHTDYFNRAISCGGSPSNEGSSTVGAIHISGTPTGADPKTDLSWMLACTDGGDRPFTNYDKVALTSLY